MGNSAKSLTVVSQLSTRDGLTTLTLMPHPWPTSTQMVVTRWWSLIPARSRPAAAASFFSVMLLSRLLMHWSSARSPTQENKEKNLKSENSHPIGITSKLPKPASLPSVSVPATRELDELKEVVTVEEDQTLYYIAQKYYHMSNTTLIDLILDCNPEITNANLIILNQKIKIHKITEESLILQDTGHTYKIHVGTFQNSSFVRFYSNEPVLKGKAIEVFSRKVSPQDNWYRVKVGPFGHKENCLKVIDQLKGKGLLPVFGGILKVE
jgi:hypothetical protein